MMAKAKDKDKEPGLENCRCEWERPARDKQNRERKLKERKKDCPVHGDAA